MGIENNMAMFLSKARGEGVSFARTCTLGRLTSYITPACWLSCVAAAKAKPSEPLNLGQPADRFFRDVLGVDTLHAVDYSGYEGAHIVHDLNKPIGDVQGPLYDAVIDGGTLEHVFNLPAAFMNVIKLTALGGHIFILSPMNNLSGHGFYQFSPELFYRVFSEGNGFADTQVMAFESRFANVERGRVSEWHKVHDPAMVGARVTLINTKPTSAMVRTRKTSAIADLITRPPLQSDYQKAWMESTAQASSSRAPVRPGFSWKRILSSWAHVLLPSAMEQSIRGRYEAWRFHGWTRKMFYETLRKSWSE